MSHARVLGIGLAALAAAAVAYAQTEVTPIPDTAPVETAPLEPAAPEAPVTWGDPQNGQTLAGTCAACHGLDGNPPDPMYPRIAGQSEHYIAEQIARFKSGERSDGMALIMKPFADMLSAQDARDVGAWFASQKAGAGVADDSLVTEGPYEGLRFYEIGQQLYRSGDADRGIPACMACHGPAGSGNPGPAYPHVGGQFAAYTQQRLETFRNGTGSETAEPMFRIMADIASRLTDEEVGALASYMEGLHPSADDLVASAAPAPAAAPGAESMPAEAPTAQDTLAAEEGATAPAADSADQPEPADAEGNGTDAGGEGNEAAPPADADEAAGDADTVEMG